MKKDLKEQLSAPQAPPNLGWLADAPLFIDATQVASFYDAVARPPGRATQIKYSAETALKLGAGAKLGLEAEASPGALIEKLAGWFPSLKAKVTGELNATAEFQKDTSEEILIEAINTPQRQLIQLAVHFLMNYPQRLFFVRSLPNDSDWRIPQVICESPRAISFFDLPSLQQAQGTDFCATRLVPTAAEFEKSGVTQLYPKLLGKDGSEPPKYPEPTVEDDRKAERKEYWKWFADNFSATKAMLVIEEAAAHDRIRWIDFRVPLNPEGDTVHLHICPRGNEDTGVFAYNLVKRGFKHGLRVVGTVKSEPDVNVLAIYEK